MLLTVNQMKGNKMMLFSRSSFSIISITLLLFSLLRSSDGQFTCTFSGSKNSAACIDTVEDKTTHEHCVWCIIDAERKRKSILQRIRKTHTDEKDIDQDFGLCVSEIQAEAMEKNIPGLHCDRYSKNDDEVTDDKVTPTTDDVAPATDDVTPTTDDVTPATDDVTPATDDVTPATDDVTPATDDVTPATDDVTPTTDDVTPTTDDTTPDPTTDDTTPATDDTTPTPNDDDHAVPDNFWTCLQQKNVTACTRANCTWCNTKGGFSLCMTGPTAKSASHSSWFSCHTNATTMVESVVLEQEEEADDDIDNVDMTCVASFQDHPIADACMTTIDTTGKPCKWCTMMNIATLCLSSEQVNNGRSLGLSCEVDDEYYTQQRQDASLHDTTIQNPYDPSCLLAYLEDSSESTCTSTVDADGNACEYCTLQDQLNMCLTSEQATMGEQFGVSCNQAALPINNHLPTSVHDDPYDTSCLLAYLQDPSKDGCLAAIDEDSNPCEFCSLQGAVDLCLTAEQAAMGEQLGITCDTVVVDTVLMTVEDDPYDSSCLLAYLQDPTKEGCLAAIDEDSAPCEFCSLQGAVDLCLTTEQAAMGEQLGITCDQTIVDTVAVVRNTQDNEKDPYDTSCMVAFWTEQSEQECIATMDATGKQCQYCSLPGSIVMCLTFDQADIGKTLGMECSSDKKKDLNDPYDMACALSYLQSPTKEDCVATIDSDGNACEFCNLQGSDFNMCLTAEQAQIGEQIGMDCDTSSSLSSLIDNSVSIPDDFFTCLQHYERDDCSNSTCTWCKTQVGVGFCFAPAVAEATKQCTFFDCEFDDSTTPEIVTKHDDVHDIYDPICLEAGMSTDSDDIATVCAGTNGSDGTPCVWCDAAGVFGLCLSSEQATAAGQYLQCSDKVAVAVTI
jgi:hypothetical protein